MDMLFSTANYKLICKNDRWQRQEVSQQSSQRYHWIVELNRRIQRLDDYQQQQYVHSVLNFPVTREHAAWNEGYVLRQGAQTSCPKHDAHQHNEKNRLARHKLSKRILQKGGNNAQ